MFKTSTKVSEKIIFLYQLMVPDVYEKFDLKNLCGTSEIIKSIRESKRLHESIKK